MKTFLFSLCLILTVLYVQASNQDDYSSLQARDDVMPLDSERLLRKRDARRKKSNKKQKKKARQNKKGKRKSLKKAKKGKTSKNRKTKLRRKTQLRNSRCNKANNQRKAQTWWNSNNNAIKIYNNLKNKEENAQSEKTLKMFTSAAKLLEDVTDNGASCKGGDPDPEVNAALETLRTCQTSALASCSPIPEFNKDDAEACKTNLEIVKDECIKEEEACCDFPSETVKNCNLGNVESDGSGKVDELRSLQKNCLNKTLPGSFRNCLGLVKDSAGLALKCLKEESDCNPETTTASSQTNTTSTTTVKTEEVFEENGVVYRQSIEYDPNTKEATITVPAHLDRIAISVVVGEEKTTVVSDTSCVVEDTPSDLDVTSFGRRTRQASKDGEITPSKPKKFKVYTDLGEMTADEQAQLSEGTKNACKGKPIHKTKIEEVDEATFNQLKGNNSLTISTARNDINNLGRQNTCSDMRVITGQNMCLIM